MFFKQLIKSSKRKKYFYNNVTWILFLLMWVLPLVDIRFGILWLVSMVTGIILSLLSKGKPHCAYFCPKGGGFQKLLHKISLRNSPPKLMTNKFVRYGITILLTVIVVSMLIRTESFTAVSANIYNGFILTSIVAIIIGFIWKPRTYCGELCHVGNILGLINKFKTRDKSKK